MPKNTGDDPNAFLMPALLLSTVLVLALLGAPSKNATPSPWLISAAAGPPTPAAVCATLEPATRPVVVAPTVWIS